MEERTERHHKGSARQILSEIYRNCEAERTERVLLIAIDFSKQPTEMKFENYTVKEFAESIIDLAESVTEYKEAISQLNLYKEFYNAIALKPELNATIIAITDQQGKSCALIAELDMDVEDFIDRVAVFFVNDAVLKREKEMIKNLEDSFSRTSKHDTWAELIPDNPFETIKDLFPLGIPMRDPFPMGISKDKSGQQLKLWYLDLHRLNNEQVDAIAEILAAKFSVEKQMILADAAISGLLIEHKWVERMSGGAENYQRTLELANFLEKQPYPSSEDLVAFIQQQTEDWIEGDRVPDPLPQKYEDVDPRIQHEELEESYEIRRVLEAWGVLQNESTP